MAHPYPSGAGFAPPQVNNDRHEPPEHHANPQRTSHRASTPVTDRPVRRTGAGGQCQGHDFARAVTKRAMPEGNRVSRISVRGFAVASATAVTTVGAVVGVASGADKGGAVEPVEAAGTTTLLADIPVGQQVQQASLTEQVQAQSDAADATARQSAEQQARMQAAKDAAAKKKAADQAAEKERLKKLAASGQGDANASFPVQPSYTIAEVKAMAEQIVGGSQFACFSNIVEHESGWRYTASNASSGAYGLVQALPGSKMASVGADWRTNPATQIKWGLKYMNSRYGSPCEAWSFWQVNHYY